MLDDMTPFQAYLAIIGGGALFVWAVVAQIVQWWEQFQDWRWERRNRK